MDAGAEQVNRPHRTSKKKKKKSVSFEDDANDVKTGPERKAVAKPGSMGKKIQISAERSEKRAKSLVGQVDRSGDETVPKVVAVVGPKGVGKSSIIRNLVKHYTRRNVGTISGPITIVAGRKRRLTFLEVGCDLPSMIDAAKVADLVLMVIDASFGFEMETFEFLNIAANHGMPRVMGVLTHLDSFKEGKKVQRTKKTLKSRFWAELYDGAKLFYLSGITTNGNYLKREVLNLARFISVTKFRPIKWRNEHPYVLADRVEDVTPSSDGNSGEDRIVAFYGFTRGAPLRLVAGTWRVHIPGLGDALASKVEAQLDPCPAPDSVSTDGQERKRKISEREKTVHAPMAVDLDGIAYDKDAVYISLPDKGVRFSEKETADETHDGEESDSESESSSESGQEDGSEFDHLDGVRMMKDLQRTDLGMDMSLRASEFQLMAGSRKLLSSEYEDGVKKRERRAAPDPKSFSNAESGNSGSDSDSGDASSSSESFDEAIGDQVNTADGSESVDVDKSESEDDDDIGAETRWREEMLARAKVSFAKHFNLSRYIYENTDGQDEDAEEGSEDDELFRRGKDNSEEEKDRAKLAFEAVRDWCTEADDRKDLRSERFATGVGEDEVFGDFEDLENDSSAGDDQPSDDDSESSDIEVKDDGEGLSTDQLLQRKEEKKRLFDSAWDSKGAKNKDKEEDGGVEVSKVSALHDSDLKDMDAAARHEIAGIPPGTYVRLEMRNVPVEFVQYFDPRYPVVIGGLKTNEDVRSTYIQARVKRHRWQRGVLKSSDPIIFSMGWRRFQSITVYSLEDSNGRRRFLKYTPEHMHCTATFWGPSSAPGTGLVMVKRLDRTKSSFRISGSGVVTSLTPSPGIVKKLKLVGEPYKIHRNTAFIKNMFNSDLEVSKFVGAAIRSVSGIRGTIKKALRSSGGEQATGPPGAFRAAFEDKLALSDLVFLRAWVPVSVAAHSETAATLLENRGFSEEGAQWRMRSVRELREARGLSIPVKNGSAGGAGQVVKRVERRFQPLRIPRRLQEALPYASQPKLATKNAKKRKSGTMEQALAVVESAKERRERSMLQMVRTISKEKMRKKKASNKAARAERQKMLAKEAELHRKGEAKRRKRQYVEQGRAAKAEDAKRAKQYAGPSEQ